VKSKEQIIIDNLVQKTTLLVFRFGCDTKNYRLLNLLPLTATELEETLMLSPMPTNKRINDLMGIGLIYREKSGAKIKLTNLGKVLIQFVEQTKADVEKELIIMAGGTDESRKD